MSVEAVLIKNEEPGVVGDQRPPRRGRFSGWRRGLSGLWQRDAPAVIWAVVLLLMVLVSALGPFFLTSPDAIEPANRLMPPSADHPFGTDEYGRDLLSRVVSAGRVSLGLGILITVVAVVMGTLVGSVAGFYERSSGVLMRLMDALMAFPAIVLAIALVISLRSGIWSEIIALGVVFIPYVARVVRSRVLTLRERGYVTAARAAGVSGPRILLTHILPNAAPAILVQAVFVYASALLADAALSFLGLGVQPPTPTWGNMIGEARTFITLAPGFMIFPGLAIVISVMALNLVGDGARGLIDQRARAVLELERVRKKQGKEQRRRRSPAAPAVD
ncbi:ABC transporter permease [Blastococcus xanthinilyticus]|uniref:Peptide/nickel transport system permease protein n=1 Tax=Blastococcus xanthinilyticus TaxID=1564164 RepID=A0A5S5D0M5_9ACTN|nr:ABC transporter permease [Blastococcus xanthinilyticus]TYP89593.1 peptide/nickel transport system permease protein [Blastococcus xanthinilyticus]